MTTAILKATILACASYAAIAPVRSAAMADTPETPLAHRWVYLGTNLLVDKNVEDNIKLLERAAKAGYNGVVLTDSKFMRWDDLPEKYPQNVARLRKACRDLKLDCIACVCPIGYSNDLLSRDPNLAEGLPVKAAPFKAVDGQLVPDDPIHAANGGFEESTGNMPTGWLFVDEPGKISFIDTDVKSEGRASLRMQDIGLVDPQNGHGRACQKLAVQPFHYYHVSMAVKTEDFGTVGDVHITILSKDGASLNHYQPHIEKTQDWKRIDVTFNSLEYSEVNLYLGVWGGKRGKIWWDDLRVEPGGLVNLVRRDGAPLKATSEDGKTVYQEGKDFEKISDPLMGSVPWPGEYTVWHEPPNVTLTKGSRIRPGQKVLLSYYHTAIIYEGQVMCCMAEPKLYEILRWQIAQVHKNLKPDGYFLSHDEIRVQGWDESCRRSKLTPGQLLAENVRKCTEIVQREDRGKPIYVWSDMFDPYHNAGKSGRYYLVRGDGPWYDSWQGLNKDVTVVNWNSDRAKRIDSLKHFAGLGNRQILAGYYDGPIDAIDDWLRDARQVKGVEGVMYTTWRSNFNDLEGFAAELKRNDQP
jgi:hypothetical protein